MLTQERVKELFDYNPDTGDLIRRVRTNNRVKVGDVAGQLDSSTGYLRVMVDKKRYKVHRIIWLWVNGEFPPEQIDHPNHIRDDNRWVNLRAVSNQENGRNQSMSSNNTSGYTGVCWDKPCKKWQVRIHFNGKDRHLGLFINKSDAISARQEANIKYGYHPNHGLKGTG